MKVEVFDIIYFRSNEMNKFVGFYNDTNTIKKINHKQNEKSFHLNLSVI